MTQQQEYNDSATMAAASIQEASPIVAAQQEVVDHSLKVQAAQPISSFDDEPLFGTDAALPDDYFTSPEWTDPSPALTTSMSFTLDSCDTSPLLTDNYDAPDLSGVPLFGDYASLTSFDLSNNRPSAKRLPQNAFNGIKDINGESALFLLRAFSSQGAAHQTGQGDAQQEQEMPLTASPCAISTPLPTSSLDARPPLSTSSSMQSLHGGDQATTHRGHKRRMAASELLPMDAPIQARNYKTPSATSRRESKKFAVEEAAIAAEKDPLVAKRLSNTLAARRSRHRKAEEFKTLHDTIEEQAREIEMWKRRCLEAEAQRDQALGRCVSL